MNSYSQLCYNPRLFCLEQFRRSYLHTVVSFLRTLLILCAVGSATFTFAQDGQPTATPTATPTPAPAVSPTPATGATPKPLTAKELLANPTAELIAETSIYFYGNGGGRVILDQIRKTTIETGKTTVMNAEGKMETASYQRFVLRGESVDKMKMRLDQAFPGVKYSLVQSDEKIFGIFNDQPFAPTEQAAKVFENQIFRGLDGLLRYKENGSTIVLSGKEKIMGVEYHRIDVTDKKGRKTRYFVSAKTYRVMMLEYEEDGKTYRRKFYDYNVAQGTLVPYRTVLYQGDKIVEETNIGTITFGQKVSEELFPPQS